MIGRVRAHLIRVEVFETTSLARHPRGRALSSAGRDRWRPSTGSYRRRPRAPARACTQPGDPARAAEAILATLDAEDTPLRLPLGADAVGGIRAKLETVRHEIDEWSEVALGTAFADDAG
jgi:hypothetical protein